MDELLLFFIGSCKDSSGEHRSGKCIGSSFVRVFFVNQRKGSWSGDGEVDVDHLSENHFFDHTMYVLSGFKKQMFIKFMIFESEFIHSGKQEISDKKRLSLCYMFGLRIVVEQRLDVGMHRHSVMSFVRLIDDIVMDKRHRMQQFKNNTKIQDGFLVLPSESHIGNHKPVWPDSFAAGKDKSIYIFDEFIDVFVVDKVLGLVDFFGDVLFQYPVECRLE